MSLHNKALLLSLSIGMPPQSKSLKDEAVRLEIKHSTEERQVQVVRKLFAKQDIKPLQQVATKARQWFRERTLPFGRGQGIIPAKAYFNLMNDLGALRLEFNREKENLLNNMTDVLRRAQVVNGSLFDVNNYPSLSEMANNIYFSIEVTPVPAGNDYDKLADLSPEEIETLKREAVLNNQSKVEFAIKDLYDRLLKGLKHVADRLTDDDEGMKIFRDTLIGNINKAIEAAETLNVADDDKLADFTSQVKDVFDGLTASDLRRDSKLRKEVAEKSADLAQRMSELF